VAFGVMLHKIHNGANLPSVADGEPYQIIGYRNSVHDYSNVHFPRSVTECNACHAGDAPDAFENAEPNNCTSCHDRTSFEANVADGWTAHTAGPQGPDTCGNCHGAAGTPFPVLDTHQSELANVATVGLNVEIVEVTNAIPGGSPTVFLTMRDNEGGDIDPAILDSFEITVAGPTSGFSWALTMRNAHQAVVVEGDRLRINSTVNIPAEATGSIAVGIAGYRYLPYGAARADSVGREWAGNPVVYVALDGGEATPPREIVSREQCNDCHGDLQLHGTFRREVSYCVTCHNQNATDVARRPDDGSAPASIDFAPMIHRIHAGGHLEEPAVIYGFGGSRHDYSEVHYPRDLATCSACHTNGTEDAPSARACVSCHDSSAARTHAALETAPNGDEACGVCHGPGRSAQAH
jgi:OmcA/MtrC family decaheme c-type cytochrome